jgi:hypothetical protein
VAIALFVLVVLGLTELLSSPRLVTRMSLALLWRFAHMFGVTEYYTLLAAWHGWYSLEIGVEIAAAVVTGFASWLLFALLYDTAGILVGLVPASMVTVVILIFRFHTRSWALIAALPMVFLPALACARFLDQRMQRAEDQQARARVLKLRAAAYGAHAQARRAGSPRGGGIGGGSQLESMQNLNGGGGGGSHGGGGGGSPVGGVGGVRGFSGFPPGGGLRGRGPGAGNVNGEARGGGGGGLQSRRPGMMSTPNLLVLTANAPDKQPDGRMAARTSLNNPKTLTTLSPIVSAGTSPADSPLAGLEGVTPGGAGGVRSPAAEAGVGVAAGAGAGGSASPKPPSGLRISPTRPRGAADRPGHTRNQHSWGGVGTSGVSSSSPRSGLGGGGPAAAAGSGHVTGGVVGGGGGSGNSNGNSKSTSPTKRVIGGSTGTGGAEGLPRPPSWQGGLQSASKAGGSSDTFDSFDSWV